jgi:hypothetical protein
MSERLPEKTALKPNEYRCCFCGEVFEKGWSDQEAEDEMQENFGMRPSDEDGIACDDCYKKFMSEVFN